MQSLSAVQTPIGKMFLNKYTIPNFQRPYSWEVDECLQLWEDIEYFASNKKDGETYFCGCVILVDGKSQQRDTIIDGQQRMTTFLLLLKSLLKIDGTNKRLERCVRIYDDYDNLSIDLRIESEVLTDDAKELRTEVIEDRLGDNPKKYNRFEINYTSLLKAVEKWRRSKTAEEVAALVRAVIDDVVVLPIRCPDQENALTIFNTVNNRGMSLSDSDIFKAKLCIAFAERRDEFLRDWANLAKVDSDNYEWLFNTYMHIRMSINGSILDTKSALTKENTSNMKKMETICCWLKSHKKQWTIFKSCI